MFQLIDFFTNFLEQTVVSRKKCLFDIPSNKELFSPLHEGKKAGRVTIDGTKPHNYNLVY